MAKFSVLCRVDAYIDYVAEVEAEDAHEAAHLANNGGSSYKWVEQGTQEFDARLYVTLDEKGDEIDGTQTGDYQ